jgi:hypothetical protein
MREDPTEVTRPPAVDDPEFEAMSAFNSEAAPLPAEDEPAPRIAPDWTPAATTANEIRPGESELLRDTRDHLPSRSADTASASVRPVLDDPLDDLPMAIRPTPPPVEPSLPVGPAFAVDPTLAVEPQGGLLTPALPTRSSRGPIAAALVLGLALGFAGGYAVFSGGFGGSGTRGSTPAGNTMAGNTTSGNAANAGHGGLAPTGGSGQTGGGSASAPAPSGHEFTEDNVIDRPVIPEPDGREPRSRQGRAATGGSARDAASREAAREANNDAHGAPRDAAQTVRAQPSPAGASTAVGRLLVRSTPDAAQVVVDGHDEGQTPATIRNLSRGPHHVRVVRDGYTAIERTVTITAGQPALSISLDLEPSVPVSRGRPSSSGAGSTEGALEVESLPPGAQVYLDGTLLGTTPFVSTSIGAGQHALRLERSGYRGFQSTVLIVRGERNHVTASLEER